MRTQAHPRQFRRLALLVVGTLTATLSVVVVGAATAPPASAAVQAAYACPSTGPWQIFTDVADDENEPMLDDTVPAREGRRQAHMTGPLSLGVAMPAGFLGANDDAYFTENQGFQFTMTRPPAHAQDFVFNADGSFTWNPKAGHLGGDSFEYTYRLGSGVCDPRRATVTIPPAGAGARLQDDRYTVRNDRSFSSPITCSSSGGCGVMLNDVNTSGAITTVDARRTELDPLHGSLTRRSDGGFTYVPEPGYVGPDRFFYRSNDTNNAALHPYFEFHYARVDLDVVAPPPPSVPIVVDDAFDVVEDTPITMTAAQLLGNDVGAAYVVGTNTSAPGSVQPTPHGSIQTDLCEFFEIVAGQCLSLNSIQAVTYTPSRDYNGPDYFGYFVSAGVNPTPETVSELGWVALSVTPVDDPPVVNPEAVTVQENTSVTIDVLANDDDPEGDLDPSSLEPDPCVELPVCIFRSLANGSWVINSDGTITYTPTPGFVGTAGFHYQVSDDRGAASRTYAVATVTANPAVDDAYTTDEDVVLTVPAPGVLGNDRAGSTTATLEQEPEHGTLTMKGDGSFSYDPDGDFFGKDSFVYRGLGADPATVEITVAPVRDDPRVTLNSACDPQGQPPGSSCAGGQDDRTVDEGSAIRLRGYLVDPDFDPGTLKVTWGDGQQTTDGYPCFIDEGCITTSTPTWPGACGLIGCPDALFFDLSHTYADDAPGEDTAYPVTVSAADADGSVTVGASATVLNVAPTLTVADDCQSEFCFGLFSRLTTAAGGTVTLQGRVTDPGTDDGTLSIDWGDGSSPTNVTLGCDPGEVCPQSPKQSASCLSLSPTPTCGFYRVTHVYDAPSGEAGFPVALTATDDDGGVDTASATAYVANAAPVTTDFEVEATEDTAVDVDLAAHVVDAGTSDADLTYTVTDGPTRGVLTGNGGVRTYTPDADVNGVDELTVEVCDPEGLCGTMVVTITIGAVDDPPVAVDDEVATAEDTPLEIPVTDLLANDIDVDGDLDPSTFVADASGSSGSVQVVDGVITYTPGPDAFGEDSFTYEICSDGACDTATVTVDVSPVNDNPSVTLSGPASAEEGADVPFTFEVRDFDPGDSFELAEGSPSCAGGTLVAGTLEITTGGGSFSCRWGDGPFDATASVVVLDGSQAPSQPGTAGLSITNVSPALTLGTTGPGLVAAGAPVAVAGTFTDPGGDTHKATIAWGDDAVTTLASVARAGFDASHAYAAVGTYVVTVTVTDDDGGTDSASFAVEVLTLADAVQDAAVDLTQLADGVSGRQAIALRSATIDLIGNNGGTAGNGALSALASGDTVVAVSRILDAEKALATVTTVDVTGPQSLLAGVARVLTEQLVARAKNATGCAPTTAASCSKGERKSFTTIDASVAAGHARFAVADWVGAATAYLKAVKAADTLI